MIIQKNINLSTYTNWRIGGIADYFSEVENRKDLEEALSFAQKRNIPYVVIGSGTNILVSDEGYRGLVIRNKMTNIKILSYKGARSSKYKKKYIKAYVSVDSGVLVNRLVRYTLDQGLSGLENFLGQPGTVGGAVYINAHNMKENDFFGDHIIEADILTRFGTISTVPKDYFKFGYDKSIIQETGDIVLSVKCELMDKKNKKHLLWEKAEETMRYRMKTQPKGYPTAGCTFRNITYNEAKKAGIPNGIISAGFLIDACGLKGTRIGGAEISKQHANFILNKENAKAIDVYRLIQLAKRKVYERFGIQLEEEIVYIGNFSNHE